ncbi:uncharacterized protein LOC112566159 [Pomacea canaliculata]|uniref:uncharacterized protein LOC112566159 n=1 Tax=Pomacea canaliculata TaxID=400727 RepID=UPI000D728B9F|nr:uncharacterized protein LOC112566159 [Pomacea canaliculata]
MGAELQKSGRPAEREQTFWLQWIQYAFPDLDSHAYFLPPVHVNRVPMTREVIAGQEVLVLQASAGQTDQSKQTMMKSQCAVKSSIRQPTRVQDSDVRDDDAMQRVLFCLKKMSELYSEVFVGLIQLQFGKYLGEPCYAAAAAATTRLPLPANLPPALPRNWKDGDFDVLVIHRCYGLVVCEIKSVGSNLKQLNLSKQNEDSIIRKKLKEAISQLDKAEAMLSHLVSDIANGLRITKTIAVPNLTVSQVQQSISGDPQLSQDLCRCLGITDPAAIAGLCLCSDQLFDPKTPWDISDGLVRELENWWQRRVAGFGPDSHMTRGLYRILVARFCGPATTVTVPSTSPVRLSVKTLGQAVSWTGECYTAQITLFPEQVQLLNMAPSRLFVAGPPGTGKTVVLLLKSTDWFLCGHAVHIVSTWRGSRAASIMLYHLLQTVSTQGAAGVAPGEIHIHHYDFDQVLDLEEAVDDLSEMASGGPLYVIADEAGPEYRKFPAFCAKLLTRVPLLHLWAASCYHGFAPAGWQVEYLTRPLRSPPAVIREIEQDLNIASFDVHPYSKRGVPDYTDGPPVRRLSHNGQGHSGDWPGGCVTCGREVASLLHKLHVGVPETASAGPPGLQWRDVLVLYWGDNSNNSGMVKGLRDAGIPVRVMEEDEIEDVATARTNVVWVTDGDGVRGLERKVVVCLKPRVIDDRLYAISRCTSQLIIVSPEDEQGACE